MGGVDWMLTKCQQVASLIYGFNHRKLARAGICAHTLTNMPSFKGLKLNFAHWNINTIFKVLFIFSFIYPFIHSSVK